MQKPLIERMEDLRILVKNRSDFLTERSAIVDTLEEAMNRIVELGAENYQLKQKHRPVPVTRTFVDHIFHHAYRGSLATGYLLYGPESLIKVALNKSIAALLCEKDGLSGCTGDYLCESCLALKSGMNFSYRTLDMKYHNSIDDMRDLISTLALGVPGRRRVYRISNVDNATLGTMRVLTKLLQEPPENAVFFFTVNDIDAIVGEFTSLVEIHKL